MAHDDLGIVGLGFKLTCLSCAAWERWIGGAGLPLASRGTPSPRRWYLGLAGLGIC
jgi:hypothetical protein